MCICFYTLDHPVYSLALATNRDEFLARPTLAAHWHDDDDTTLSGVDVTGGGTWFGLEKKTGKFGLLTNVREEVSSRSRSRGKLVTDWLDSMPDVSVHSHLDTLRSNMMEYAGFNLLLGQISPTGTIHMAFLSNRSEHVKQASENALQYVECCKDMQKSQTSGVLSNGALACGLDTPATSDLDKAWPKMETGRKAFQDAVLITDKSSANTASENGGNDRAETEQRLINSLLDVLNIAPISINDKEDVRSCVLVTAFDMFPPWKTWYATRAQSVLLVERGSGRCTFVERQAYEEVAGEARWNGKVEKWRFGIGKE